MVTTVTTADNVSVIPPVSSSDAHNTVNASSDSVRIAAFANLLETQTLEQLAELNSAQTQAQQNNSAADTGLTEASLLNLSPQALVLLNGTGSISGLPTFGTAVNNNLTSDQQQQLASVIAQFSNSPFTSTTFIQFQNALTAIGLNPELLSLQEMAMAMPFTLTPDELVLNANVQDLIAA